MPNSGRALLALGLGGGDKVECVLSAQGPWDLSLWGGNRVPEKERNSTLWVWSWQAGAGSWEGQG